MSKKLGVYLLLIFSLGVACQRANVTRENGTKKSISSIPLESVDAETGGKKGGGAHFTLSSNELFLDYQYFDDAEEAAAKFNEARSPLRHVIEEGNVSGATGVHVGKFSFTENESSYANNRFCLRWSNAKRYVIVCSESRQAIEEFRTVYDL